MKKTFVKEKNAAVKEMVETPLRLEFSAALKRVQDSPTKEEAVIRAFIEWCKNRNTFLLHSQDTGWASIDLDCLLIDFSNLAKEV